jgi:hypothetical protein
LSKLKQIIRHPLTLGLGITLVGLGSIGTWQLHRWLKQQLPDWLASQATRIIHRPVQISEVQQLSLTQLTLGPAFLPATPQNPNSFKAQSVVITLDPWQLLHRGTLKAVVQFQEAQGQIQSNAQGQWGNVQVEEVKLPLPLDLTVKTEKAAIQIQKSAKSPLVSLQVTGKVRYLESASSRWQYALNVRGKQTDIDLNGETLSANSQSQLALAIKQLSLQEFSVLLPSSWLKIEQGNIIADLSLFLPNLEHLSQAQGKGTINLNPLEARLKKLEQPLFLNLNIALKDQKIIFDNTQLAWGTLTAKLRGYYHFVTGFNLNSEITLNQLNALTALTHFLPKGISLRGQIKSQINLTGSITDPLVKGWIKTSQPLSLNRVPLGQLTAAFTIDKKRVTIKEVSWLSDLGKFLVKGYLEPNFLQLWQDTLRHQPIRWQKIPFHFSARGKVSLTPSLTTVIPRPIHLKVADLFTQAEINGNLGNPQIKATWQPLSRSDISSPSLLSLSGQLTLTQQRLLLTNDLKNKDQTIAKIIGKSDFQQHQWQLIATSQAIAFQDYLGDRCSSSLLSYQAFCQGNLRLEQGELLVKGKFAHGLPTVTQAQGLAQFRFQQSPLIATLQWQGGILTNTITWDQLSFNPWLDPAAPLLQVKQGRLQNIVATQDLWLRRSPNNFKLNLDAIRSSLQTQFQIGKETGNIQASLAQNQIKAFGRLPHLNLNALFPSIKLPIELQNTHFQLTNSLDSLLAQDISLKNLNNLFNNLTGKINSQVLVAEQPVSALVTIQDNQWHVQAKAPHIRLKTIKKLPSFVSSALTSLALNSNLALSGSLPTLLFTRTFVPVKLDYFSLASYPYELRGKGDIILTKSWTKPDIETVKLSLQTHSPLTRINLNPILQRLAIQQNLLPQQLKLQGQGDFSGTLIVKQLLSHPFLLDNLQIIGQLNLRNLQLNRFAFEPQLSGPIVVKDGQIVSLNLRGKRDQISTQWQSCFQSNCPLPYFPKFLNIQQFNRQNKPIIITGKGDRDRFVTQIQSFPVELLELAWLQPLGIDQPLAGIAQGNLVFNLADRTALGKLSIDRPHFSFLQAEHFNTDFRYADQFISLQQTILRLGKQDYRITNGSLNLRSGALLANLSIRDANIHDLLQEWNIYEIAPLLARLQTSLGTVKTTVINPQNPPLSEQLNQLWQVDRLIRQQTQQQRENPWPQVLDLQGKFAADFNLGGTLLVPTLDFKVQGKHWLWQTQAPAPALIDPLGLVIKSSQVIPLDQFSVKGGWHGHHFSLESYLQSSGMEGEANLQALRQGSELQLESANFRVNNLSLDSVQDFVKFPLDISGFINLSGNVNGSFRQPQLKGIFNLQDLAWNGQLLHQDIAGKFAYQDRNFSLTTTSPNSIQLASDLSLPGQNNNNYSFGLQVKLTTEALALLENLTSDRLIWKKGEGSLYLQTKGTITPGNPLQLNLDPQSEIRLSLADVALKTPFFRQLLNLDGNLILKDDHFIFENLKSNIGGQGIISEGILPLFPPSKDTAPLIHPLTISFTHRDDDPSHLYRGEFQGNISIKGSALTPIIGGKILLKNGILSLPAILPTFSSTSPVQIQWFEKKTPQLFLLEVPQFQDLEIVLDQVELRKEQKFPRFAFNVSGLLRLNGLLNSLQAIEPRGQIQVNRGFMDFFPSRVFVNEHQPNTLTFFPHQGILNPVVDLKLQMYLFDLGLITPRDNSIPDDLVQSGQSQSLLLNIGIQGNAAQLLPEQALPGLTRLQRDRCPLLSNEQPPFSTETPLSPTNLSQLSDCLKNHSLGISSMQDLVRSPLVSISSVPPMTRNQYLTLFANQYPNISLQEQNDQPLVKAGFPQVGATVIPWVQNWIFDANMQFITWGNQIGLDTLQIYPTLSTQYRLDKNQVIRVDYDYNLNQARIRYQQQF